MIICYYSLYWDVTSSLYWFRWLFVTTVRIEMLLVGCIDSDDCLLMQFVLWYYLFIALILMTVCCYSLYCDVTCHCIDSDDCYYSLYCGIVQRRELKIFWGSIALYKSYYYHYYYDYYYYYQSHHLCRHRNTYNRRENTTTTADVHLPQQLGSPVHCW